MPSLKYPTVEVVSQTPPGRLNEDAWLVAHTGPLGERLVCAAIDGATTRLTPPPLQQYLDSRPQRLTPAAFAARLTRETIVRQTIDGLHSDLRALLLDANNDLGRSLTELFGALRLDSLGLPEEVYQALSHDPRFVRLGLPACVVTVIDYDPAAHSLEWAHAGDTALIVAYEDGRVEVPTNSDGVDFDGALKKTARKLKAQHPDLTFRELAQLPEVQKLNLNSGIRHNFVDKHGLPQPRQGIGVINGMSELRYFVRTGSLSLEGVLFVLVLTDGLEWPADAEEVFAPTPEAAAARRQERLAHMTTRIADHGIGGYLALLRDAEEHDPDHEQYPRLKTHDDATGVLLRFE